DDERFEFHRFVLVLGRAGRRAWSALGTQGKRGGKRKPEREQRRASSAPAGESGCSHGVVMVGCSVNEAGRRTAARYVRVAAKAPRPSSERQCDRFGSG